MDPRLEFAFQLLMDTTQLSRHEVMDHVFEGDMLDEINQLFLPHMKSTLVWYYQEAEESETLRPTEMVKSLLQKRERKAETFALSHSSVRSSDSPFELYFLQMQMKTSTSRPGPNTSVTKVKEQKEVKEPGKKKLFLTDGWQVPCTGICIYMFRYKHNTTCLMYTMQFAFTLH